MKSLTEYLTEGRLTVKIEKPFINKEMDDKAFEELAPYAEEIYNAYVENFGDTVPKKPWGGMRQTPFEKEIKELVDTNNIQPQASAFINFYVFSRLEGNTNTDAIESAKEMYYNKYGR